ncbi:MAG: ribbon-helix-helix domain-containing protein [Candidatus Kariarchaeaceae archaeon]
MKFSNSSNYTFIFLHGLDELVRLQKYPNRSEAIRVAIRDMLKDELWHARLAQTAKVST